MRTASHIQIENAARAGHISELAHWCAGGELEYSLAGYAVPTWLDVTDDMNDGMGPSFPAYINYRCKQAAPTTVPVEVALFLDEEDGEIFAIPLMHQTPFHGRTKSLEEEQKQLAAGIVLLERVVLNLPARLYSCAS